MAATVASGVVAARDDADDIDDFLRTLDTVVQDAVAAEAAGERSQERTLRSIAASEGTLVGLLVDLAERSVPVVVRLVSGRSHRGRVLAVARDAVVLRDGPKPPVVMALGAVASVRPQPSGADVEATGGRPAPLGVSLAALLAGFADARPRVQVVAGGDEPVAGELRSVGVDVLTLRLDGDRGLAVHVALAAVHEVVLLDL
jgi:hypothetical protein